MVKKSPIVFFVIVFVVTVLGSLSYQQVAVLNLPQSPDQQVEPIQTPTPTPQEKRKVFESSENEMKIAFPDTWTFTDNTPANEEGTWGKIIQSVTLSNYEPTKEVSGGLPENASRVEILISFGGADKSLDQIIDCGGKVISCQNTEINGNYFKRATQSLNTGSTLIQLATKKEDKIFFITALAAFGSSYTNNLAEIENIIKSIEIIK